MEAKELEARIEQLLAQLPSLREPEKTDTEKQIRAYALQYKEVTGNYYIRSVKGGNN
jgi:hypothetical protein